MESASINRRSFLSLSAAAAALPVIGAARSASGAAAPAPAAPASKDFFVNWSEKRLVMPWPGMKESVKLRVVADTHFNYYDERDAEYAKNYARMCGPKRGKARYLPEEESFKKYWGVISGAKKAGCDAVLLLGDILSFPTLANVEAAKMLMDSAGVPCYYVAGNHDWHFEGLKGTSTELRETWVKKRLMPLYPEGADPMMYSAVVKGVRIVAIDNSNFLITPEQLAFWKAEVAKGDPVVLIMHIPIWVEGAEDEYFAGPRWGADVDPYFRIERRPRWPKKANPETYEFREEVLNTPNLVGVFTGHMHRYISSRSRGQNLFSVMSGRTPLNVTIR